MKNTNYINFGEEFKRKSNIIDNYCFKTLRECYDRWSDAKESVYHKYYNLLINNCDSVIDYGIKSYNCNFIILHAIVIKDGIKYYLLITPSHNYYEEME